MIWLFVIFVLVVIIMLIAPFCEMTKVHPTSRFRPLGTNQRYERTSDGWLVCWMPGCKAKAEWSEVRRDAVTYCSRQEGIWCNDHCPRGVERWIEFKIRYGTYGRRKRQTGVLIPTPKQSVIEEPIRAIDLE